MSAVPAYVLRFADVLLGEKVGSLQLDLCRPPVCGYHGILTTHRIQYNQEAFNLLGRTHEFTFEIAGVGIPLSLQLYLNLRDHYRLFCYTKTGMLFSVNLTLLHRQSKVLALSQTIRLATRGISAAERASRAEQLCGALTRLGLEVEDHRLVLGTFDGQQGRFVDTTARAFIRDFALVSLLKGHYMGNKGYSLPGLPKFAAVEVVGKRTATSGARLVPLWMRYQVLEAARGKCRLCGRSPRDGVKMHVDHVVPFSLGGLTEIPNLQSLCHECNLGKGNRSKTRFR
jgi:hypothetical protein